MAFSIKILIKKIQPGKANIHEITSANIINIASLEVDQITYIVLETKLLTLKFQNSDQALIYRDLRLD